MSVTLDVQSPGPQFPSVNEEFVDNTAVKAALVYELGNGNYRAFESSIEIITMKAREDYIVYFFFPEEVRERDDLPNRPFAWLVELTIGGKEIAVGEANVSRNISNATAVARMRELVTATSGSTSGQLLALDEVPYWVLAASDVDIRKIPPIRLGSR